MGAKILRVRMPLSRFVVAGCSFLGFMGLGGCDAEEVGGPATEERARLEQARLADGHSLVRLSESGEYRVVVRREEGAAPVYSAIHAWLVRIEGEDGEPIRPTRLAFSGGMPQHGHGFQTAPYVTDALDGGWFRISGVRFHMAGEWMLRVEFVGPRGPDVAVFEISVPH